MLNKLTCTSSELIFIDPRAYNRFGHQVVPPSGSKIVQSNLIDYQINNKAGELRFYTNTTQGIQGPGNIFIFDARWHYLHIQNDQASCTWVVSHQDEELYFPCTMVQTLFNIVDSTGQYIHGYDGVLAEGDIYSKGICFKIVCFISSFADKISLQLVAK